MARTNEGLLNVIPGDLALAKMKEKTEYCISVPTHREGINVPYFYLGNRFDQRLHRISLLEPAYVFTKHESTTSDITNRFINNHEREWLVKVLCDERKKALTPLNGDSVYKFMLEIWMIHSKVPQFVSEIPDDCPDYSKLITHEEIYPMIRVHTETDDE